MKSLIYAIKKEWYNIFLLFLPIVVIPFIWDLLPERIPSHWNFEGEVDEYSNKIFGVFFLPLLNIIIYLILLYLPKIDPKQRISIDQKPIPVLRTLTVVLILGIHIFIMSNAMGYNILTQGGLFLGLSLFFVVMGNYLRTIKPNYFIGIRVPWALEDDDNWRKTHKVGSYLWVAGGLLLLLLYPLLDLKTYSTLFGVVAMLLALIPTVYSFYLYQKQP
ncbi:SdpI family protein [Fodinibius saliphilus]|uniref:SdpI family protein n=1 Tax=Fodinibius saliphilus TaxID=1920650 RepID=UPI0011093CA0|nr:SdpI family protein [Fodinibius saliphilus]